jgi:hypothetical protein
MPEETTPKAKGERHAVTFVIDADLNNKLNSLQTELGFNRSKTMRKVLNDYFVGAKPPAADCFVGAKPATTAVNTTESTAGPTAETTAESSTQAEIVDSVNADVSAVEAKTQAPESVFNASEVVSSSDGIKFPVPNSWSQVLNLQQTENE